MAIEYAIASAAISFMGSMSAAKAAKREAAMRARQIEIQKKQAKLQSLQEHNARLQNLQAFIGMNQAVAGTMGRDLGSDRSLKRLIQRAKENTAIDADRARVQELATIGKLSQAQQIAGERGRNRARAFRYQAFGSLIGGAMKAAPLMGSAPTASVTPQSSLGPLRFSTFNTGLDNI